MLRLSSPSHERLSQADHFNVDFGGAEANVAVALSNFKIDTQFLTRLPDNELGNIALSVLRKYDVDVQQILRGGRRLGIYFLEKGSMNRPSKIIYDRDFSSFAEIQPGMIDWENIFEGAKWFHWSGITPAVSESAAKTCLEAIKTANSMGIKVSCDLNFRMNLWKYGKNPGEVMSELLEGCDLILSNEEDSRLFFGINPENIDSQNDVLDETHFISIAKQLIKKFRRVKTVAFSYRRSINADINLWSGFLFDGKVLYKSPIYELTDIVDRVGSGDSFMSGLIYGFLKYTGKNQMILDFATASSCLKHSITGDFNLVSVEEVLQLMNGNTTGRIIR